MCSKQLQAMGLGTHSNTLEIFFSSKAVKNKKMTNLTEVELNDIIRSVINMKPDIKDPFYVLDLGMAKCIMEKWNSKLPQIQPFYAVKCNPEPIFLASLAMMGAGFDCASQAEIEAVMSIGVSPDRIVFASTCKPETHLKYAAAVGVNLATYDSSIEVEKIKKWHPKCALLLRIKVGDDNYARRPLGNKFGALPEEIIPLLQAAHTAQLSVVGVAFHLGSAVTHPEAYRLAIASAKMIFDTAVQLGMPRMHMLDIGGGFTASPQFDDAAATIQAAVESYFGNEPGLKLISEPGRFFAETSFTLVTNIIGKRVRGNVKEYWINDGLYGSMMNMLHDPDRVIGTVKPLALNSYPDNPTCSKLMTYSSTVYGPIANSLDTVLTDYQLPELNVNDWLVFSEMGAYSASAGSKFNGFDTSAIRTYLAYSNKSGESKMNGNKI
ncbi:Ornithine decarboxylase [Thalictrum thalictroides]|uniref:ornithine decarboxylase n=1 Tax=Thalictrum thalictroides TaxID=46969 RepID=A0A7J6VDQ9_THATH|nr:Ornithine decarboxylase [Thalictrum thalictroides]